MISCSLLLQLQLTFLRYLSFFYSFRAIRLGLGFSSTVSLSLVLALFGLNSQAVLAQEPATYSTVELLGIAIVQVGIGVLCAAPLVFSIEYLAVFARFCDVFRGAQFAEQVLFSGAGRVSLLENASVYAMLLFGFTFGGYQSVLSLLLIAPGGNIFLPGGLLSDEALHALLVISNDAIEAGFLFAAPVLLVGFLSDAFTMILSRSLGRVNASFEFLPLKLMLGLLAVASLLSAGLLALPQSLKL